MNSINILVDLTHELVNITMREAVEKCQGLECKQQLGSSFQQGPREGFHKGHSGPTTANTFLAIGQGKSCKRSVMESEGPWVAQFDSAPSPFLAVPEPKRNSSNCHQLRQAL